MIAMIPFDGHLSVKTYLIDVRKSVLDEAKTSKVYLSDRFKNHIEIYGGLLKLATKYGYYWSVSKAFRKGSA